MCQDPFICGGGGCTASLPSTIKPQHADTAHQLQRAPIACHAAAHREQVEGVPEENVTISIEVLVAEIVSGIALKLCAPGLLKVMVWLFFCTVSVKGCITVPLAFMAVMVSG